MIQIIQGDITTLAVDAVVNASNISIRKVRGFSHKEHKGSKEVSFAARHILQ